MSQAARSRAAARGWVTWANERLKKLCGQSDLDVVELRDAIDEFDQRLVSLDNTQSEVEIEWKEEDLMKDINSHDSQIPIGIAASGSRDWLAEQQLT